MTADKPRRLPRFSLRSLLLLVALAGSGYGLWSQWEPWEPWVWAGELVNRPKACLVVAFHPDDDDIFVTYGYNSSVHQWNWPSGTHNAVGMSPALVSTLRYTTRSPLGNSRLQINNSDGYINILSAESGKLLTRLKADDLEITRVTYSPDGRAILGGTEDTVVHWTRRHPEYWWGVAWLPEFWITVILSTALLWSLRRDTLNLKTAAEPNSA